MNFRLTFFAFMTLSTLAVSSLSADAGEHTGHFRHVVCFKFKDGTAAEEVSAIEKAFGELRGKIDTIIDYEWGTSDNIEPLNDGFTHCFVVTFKDKKGLEAYLPHEAHQAFVAQLKPKLDKVFVFDYTAR
ncbi:MAG: Dabb family protein [Verrucomicrobiales bacterium]|nr:Dabb family protein [Verrucomicrobiae bacterium]MCP5553773.1 Dabb family protein [Akkermansiaceae bacterium]